MLAALAAAAVAAPAAARDAGEFARLFGVQAPAAAPEKPAAELAPYLQCVPYARKVSGIQLFGDARTWWEQAQGRYATGRTPRVGAVMTFRPSGAMVLGHVAAVSKVIDARRVLLDHANWSPIEGRRGQVEKDVLALDVSPAGDWSQVRVWYAPLGDVGTTAWPVEGFIYAEKARTPVAPAAPVTLASAPRTAGKDRFQSAFAKYN